MSSPDKRRRTDDSSSSSSSSSILAPHRPSIESFQFTDVAYVLANVGYTNEVQTVPFLDKSNYHDQRIISPLLPHYYGKSQRILFHHACAFGRLDRVQELLRYHANPDDHFYPWRPSGLGWAIVRGHPEIVDYLMTHYYEPVFQQYERENRLPVSQTIPTTSPIPPWKNYEVRLPGRAARSNVPSKNARSIFSIVPELKFLVRDFGGFPGELSGVDGKDFGIVTDEQIQALHALLYRPSPNNRSTSNSSSATLTTVSSSSIPVSASFASPSHVYSVFWHCRQASQWLTFLLPAMVLCREPHSTEMILNMWASVRIVGNTENENDPDENIDILLYAVAIRAGNTVLFRALEQTFPLAAHDQKNLMFAIVCHGSVDMVREYFQRAQRNGNAETFFKNVSIVAVKRDDNYAMLEYLRDHMPSYVWHSLVIDECVKQHRLDKIQWLRNINPLLEWSVSAGTEAARYGHLDILTYLHANGCRMGRVTCAVAALYGRLDALRWLHAHGCPMDEMVMVQGITSGNLAILEFLRSCDPPCPWRESVTRACAEVGNMEMLQWLRSQNPPCPWDELTAVAAAQRQDRRMIKWALREAHPPCPWDERLLNACSNEGLEDIIEWLREYFPERMANYREIESDEEE